MGPVVVLKGYDKFEDGVMMAVKNMVESGGIGHTAGLFRISPNLTGPVKPRYLPFLPQS